MCDEGGKNGIVGRVRRFPSFHAIVGQHREKGCAASGDARRRIGDEGGRAQIEQRRRRDAIGRRLQQTVEPLRQIRPNEAHIDPLVSMMERDGISPVRSGISPGDEMRARRLQERRIVINENPILLPPKEWRQRPQIGACAAPQIEDQGPLAPGQMARERLRKIRTTGATIGRLA